MDTIYLIMTAGSFGIGLIILIGGVFDLKFIDSSKLSEARYTQNHAEKRFGSVLGGILLIIFGIILFIK
jgi:hypothetical protein